MSSLATAAAKYASLGFAIIPLHGITNGACTCGKGECSSKGKHPIGEHGASNPIIDAELATDQWRTTPTANIGIVAGASRRVIIDLDSPEAKAHFKLIADKDTLAAIDTAPIAKTGKGWHVHFDTFVEYAPSVGSGDDHGIDIRGGVSYIVAPPSLHANGYTYTWIQGNEVTTAPPVTPWLHKYITDRTKTAPRVYTDDARIIKGERNKELASIAGTLRNRGLSHSIIAGTLHQANKEMVEPPLKDGEVDVIARSVSTYAPGDTIPTDLIAMRSEQAAAADPDLPILFTKLTPLPTKEMVETDPPPIDWIWDGYIAPGTVNMIHGEGGVGKSMLALKIIEQALRGGSLFGGAFRPVPVISLDGENAPGLIHNRIQLTTIRADDQLHTYAVPIAILGLEDLTTSLIDHLAKNHGDALFVIDSQRALWSGDEKEQDQAGIMLRGLARHLEGKKSSVLIIHHDTKAGAYSGTSDINAALSGCRLHLERSKNPTEQSTRHLTQPKNRIAQEAPRQVFEIQIKKVMNPTLRREESGIKIVDKIDIEEAKYQEDLSALRYLASQTGGVTYHNFWKGRTPTWAKIEGQKVTLISTYDTRWARMKADLGDGFTITTHPEGRITAKAIPGAISYPEASGYEEPSI